MTGLERTIKFLKGESTDRPPFHPIIMRWAAKHANVKYRDFCTIPKVKTEAMIFSAREFDHDWVTVMSDPWAEASAFGIEVEYPEDSLPIGKRGFLNSAGNVAALDKYNPLKNARCSGRLEEIRLFAENAPDKFIVGWVEGPVAEYVDLRGATNASLDFLTEPDAVGRALDLITECAADFIELQVKSGAHCIGIGDAFCSQIGPELYYSLAFERQKKLAEHVRSFGAIAKLHICGDTTAILDGMISTGCDIIDIDHLVEDISRHAPSLASHQVFCGKCNPVTVVENGDEKLIRETVKKDYTDSAGRCIISAGCEITPGTSVKNMNLFRGAVPGLA